MLKNKKRKRCEEGQQALIRFETGFRLMNKWLSVLQRGNRITQFFEDNKIENIAIYGWGDLGKRLNDELKDSSVRVKYIIDRRAEHIKEMELDIDIINLEQIEQQETVDAIVVTPVQYFWSIEKDLAKLTSIVPICLEDIIDYQYEK